MRVTTGPFSLSSRYNGQGFRKAWSVYGSTVEVGVLIIEAITVVSPVDQDRCWGLTLTANVTIARRRAGGGRAGGGDIVADKGSDGRYAVET